MFKKIWLTKEAPAPIGPYSQAVEFDGLMFCSGQIPLDPVTNQVVEGGVKAQAEQVMKNIGAVLKSADLNYSHIIKTTIFLTSMNDFATVNDVYAKHFTDDPPARSTIAVSALPKGVQVEIEVIARRV